MLDIFFSYNSSVLLIGLLLSINEYVAISLEEIPPLVTYFLHLLLPLPCNIAEL